MFRASLLLLPLLPLAFAAAVPQKSARKPTVVKPTPKPAPKATGKPTPKPASTAKPVLPTPAAVDPKLLQQALAGAGAATPATESGLTSAMVEAVAAGKGRIDYGQGFARAIGLGALPPPSLSRSRAQDTLTARDAALTDALRTLSMSVQQVRVSASSRVSNYTLKSDEVRVKLAGLIKSAEVIEEKLLPEAGIYRVIVQVPLVGAGSVAEAVGVASESKSNIVTESLREPKNPYAPGAPAPGGVLYTGLIVDCRGLGLTSSPSPKLWSERGDEVFGTISVSNDFLQEQGIVAYPRSFDTAQSSPRIGSRPLIIRARRCRDAARCEPLISASDAQRIREANLESKFLERCAVVFVTDP
ncbi:hypothetical protein [Armatimonas sp.]|uniref:hypothetical protein n=1 Tax=Armatimonas sp. TaxID=1872638 RepID=UPI00286A4E56|nr:hypothetical protein [Armatimonas sp.]